MTPVPLTPDQLRAVDISGRHLDACVVAGPGSGKTTVLVEYFRRLVEAGVDPLRILTITFTEKAAGNMRKKLAEAFAEHQTIRASLERAWVSTVHGFCARLLRENAVFAGVDPEFYVADERESWRLQQHAIDAAMEELFGEHPEDVRALIRGLSSYEFEDAVLSAYDAMRGAGIGVADLDNFRTPPGVTIAEVADTVRALRNEKVTNWKATQREQYESAIEGGQRILSAANTLEAVRAAGGYSCHLGKCKKSGNAYNLLKRLGTLVEGLYRSLVTEHYAHERQTLLDAFRRFDRLYRAHKRHAGALDFADLEEFTVRLLEDHPETRERIRSQFDHILMDEFQDTNGQQFRLLQLIRPADRFYAVGDLNQSIFGFRHAEPKGFLEYRDDVKQRDRRLVELTGNFRSRPDILSAVETIVEQREGIEPRRLVAHREFAQAAPYSVEVLYATEDEAMEAQLVACRVRELLKMYPDFTFKDVAVLVRNTEVLGAFSTAFDYAGIPYLVNRGRGFYESREVNDLSHLLRVIANPRDELSLATVLRSPLAGVSDEALLQLRIMGDNIGAALMRMGPEDAPGFDPADYAALSRFRDRLKEWRIRRDYVSFDRLLLAAIDDCGYPAAPNIDRFLAQSREAAGRMTLSEFVEDLALVRDSNPREPDVAPEDSADAVKVMTIHSAKGLEFPIVFVAAMHKGINTSLSAVEFSREFGLGVTWRDPDTNDEAEDLFQTAIHEERKRREKEEGHRLLYVAMTRAEHHLVLSFSGRKQNWASVLVDSLNLDLKQPCEETQIQTSPHGHEWKLRLLVAEKAPELPPAQRDAAKPDGTVAYLPTPIVSEQQDTGATVTSLAAFAACPRKYFLGSYLGFSRIGLQSCPSREAGHQTLSAGDFGAQVHALLAGASVPNPDPEALRLSTVFHQSPLGRRAARALRAEREFDFVMSVEGLVIRGQIDLWFEEAGELIIVDYKTDALTAVEAHQRAADYSLQLRLYAAAVEQIAGRPVNRAYLHFLRPNTIVEVDLTPSLLESPEQIVRDFQEAQAKMDFPLIEGEHCKRCPFFRDLCPAMYNIHREANAALSR